MKNILLATFLSVISLNVSAVEHNVVEKAFKERFPFSIISIEKSPLPGVDQIVTKKGVFYMSEDGKTFIHGSLFSMGNSFVNLTEERYLPIKREALDEIKPLIHTFKAENEKTQIYVFTDVTCGYCAKLHRELDTYLQEGITVHYVAFPRGGMNSPDADLNKTAWCSEDLRSTMSSLFSRQDVPQKKCDIDIQKMYDVGELFKINGTPAIVTNDLRIIPGYRPAKALAKELNI